MATQSLMTSTLRIDFENGMNEKGEPIIKRKAFSNIQSGVTADQLLQAAQALASLQVHPVIAIIRQDAMNITA
ncbi:DUF1659 domain-containing protein [Peribacillus saganii]|uniref:DUF1659 domain-containing protein n=1 Tax=Peribacillus saganii TaxID=2303992 RepID=A0A372LSV3_9BACI|nr:DUF1659 domain-containing protein [Peribacillus saganii]RFU70977.1 DUF1659 domain-containing protein [Peribacillus saganii]